MLNSASVQFALLYAVLGATVYCFTAMGYSSKRLKPSITSSYITLQPIMVALLSVWVFGRTISFQVRPTRAIAQLLDDSPQQNKYLCDRMTLHRELLVCFIPSGQ